MSPQKTAATHTTDTGNPVLNGDVEDLKESVEKIASILDQFRPVKHYIWREIEREGENREPLRVKLQDLTTAQTEAIPWGSRVPLRKAFEAIAPYVVEWNFKAENTLTGEVIPVPPPAEAGWEVFELMTTQESGGIVNWLKVPHIMKGELEKKSAPSTTTSRQSRRRG